MKLAKAFDRLIEEFGLGGESFVQKSDLVKELFDEIHNPENISKLFPYKYFCYENGIYINGNDSGGFVLEVAPQVGVDEKNLLQLEGFLRDQLPQGSFLQFLLLTSSRVDYILDRYLSSKSPLTEVQAEFFKRRSKFLHDLAFRKTESNLRVRDFRLFVSFSCQSKNEQDLISQAKLVKDQMEGLLQAMSMPFVQLDPKALINLVDEVIHPKANEHKKYDPTIPINQQLTRRDHALIHLADKLTLGDLSIENRCFTVSEFPDGNIPVGAVNALLGDQINDSLNLSCNFGFCYTVAADINNNKREQLLAKGHSVIKSATTWLGQRDIALQKVAAEWQILLPKLIGGERIFSECFQIFITDSTENIDKSEQTLRSIFNVNRWKIIRERYVQLPSLLGTLPMMPATGLWDQYRYFQFLTTSPLEKILALLPISAEWKGTAEQGMLLTARRGQLFSFSVFEKRKNYNVTVVAPSGGGKSVFVQELAFNMLAQNTKVFILDIGRSYEKMTNLLGGDFVEFRMEQGISLNPFSNIPVNEYTENFLDYAKRTVALMASPSGNITDLERSIIEACLNRTWKKHKQNTTITLLCEELKREGSIESANLARMLYPYTKDGNFGKFFEAKAEVNFTNPLTVIEFEEIADREDLLAVVMQIVSIQIVQMFSGDRQTPFILIVDEAWRTMEKFAPLLERFVRTFRKYGGSLIIVTQAYSDFLKSSSSKTIWDNSQWRLFLSHDSDSVRTIRSTEHFEEPFLKLLETVRMSRGQYSEVLITSSQETVVGRLMLDKYSQALYSTNAEDYNKISGLMKSGLSIVEAIEKVAV